MPLYEYKCKKCGHRFEKIVKFSDPPLKKCPKCKGAVEQLISSSAIQFKGTGWYVTDYAGKKPSEAPSAEKSAEKTESKSEEKSGGESTEKKKEPAKDTKKKVPA